MPDSAPSAPAQPARPDLPAEECQPWCVRGKDTAHWCESTTITTSTRGSRITDQPLLDAFVLDVYDGPGTDHRLVVSIGAGEGAELDADGIEQLLTDLDGLAAWLRAARALIGGTGLPGSSAPTVAGIQSDIRTVLAGLAETQPADSSSSTPMTAASQLLTTIVDTATTLDRRHGREDWPQADQRSDTAYWLTGNLISETMRRYVIGAHHDGRRAAVAAKSMCNGLIANVQITAAQYTGGRP